MHISFSHNISNLKNFYTKENIEEDIMLKGDLQLLNVFESMVILDHIYCDIRNNPAPENLQVTFSEFCVMSYLLQTISNNFSKLPDQYKKNKAFKEIAEKIDESYAWQSSDRLSIAHTMNLPAFYNINNSLILEHIRANFLDDKLLPLITDYCTNLFKEHELALVFPKITGGVDHFQGIEHISPNINKLKLPLNNARGQKPICKDDLYKLLCVNTILLNEIKENNKKLFDEKTFEAMVLVTLVNQAHANCLISLSNQADFTEDNLINNHLRPIRALRKDTAHTGNLKFVEYLDKYVWDQYEKFGELLLYNGGETRYRQIKELINTPIPTTKKEEIEKPVDISRAQTKNVATSTKRKEPMKKEQLFNEELLKYFKELPVSPSQISDTPVLDGKSISYKIMEILKEPYNSKQPISHENITKIKELMDYSNFNPNITIPVKYESPIRTLAEYAKKGKDNKPNNIDQIFSKSKKECYTDPKYINHRPIDLLCQIASNAEELELIEQMIAKGANLILRDQKDFGLVEHAIINNKTKAFEIVLKNIPNDLLLKIMDGSILGYLEEGYEMKTRCTYPIFLAIALKKEEHATMLLSYDQQHDHKFEGTEVLNENDEVIGYNKITDVMVHGLAYEQFNFVKLLLKEKVYRERIQDVPSQLKRIVTLYSPTAKEHFLKCLVECEVDLCKVLIVQDNNKISLLDYYRRPEMRSILLEVLPSDLNKLKKIISDPKLCDLLSSLKKIKEDKDKNQAPLGNTQVETATQNKVTVTKNPTPSIMR